MGALTAAAVVIGSYGLHAGASAFTRHVACDRVRAYAKQTGAVQRLGDGSRVVTVLGDSYSTGDTLENRDDAWTYRLAADLPATVDVIAQGGTGFVNAGFCGDGTFAARAGDVPDDDSLLIIEGGLNDVGRPSGSVERAARQLLSDFSGRDVVLVGPVNAPATTGEQEVDRELRRAAGDYDVQYVSALGWSGISFGPDRKHMTPAGHAVYAQGVAAAIGP